MAESKDKTSNINSLLNTPEFTQTAQLQPARLGGVKGIGILQITRGQNEGIADIDGTWRLEQPGQADTQVLMDAYHSGTPLVYQGVFIDAHEGVERQVEVTVKLSSVQAYQYDPALGEDAETIEDETKRVTYFNYHLVGDLPA